MKPKFNPENAFSYENEAKLAAIEALATADQTGAEIKVAYEAEADTNAYLDAEKSKLAAIEALATADQTGAEIKTAYEAEADTNAYTDAEKAEVAANTAKDTYPSADSTKVGFIAITQAVDLDALESGTPTISSGTAAPGTTPGKVGDNYVDTTAKKLYFATGTASSADWTIAN